MAIPEIASASLDKASYAAGETMILTVVGSDADEESIEVTIKLRSAASGEESAPVTVTAVIDQLGVFVTGDRAFTLVSRVGNTFTLTATA